MSTDTLVAIAGLVLMVLGLMTGAAWWMSALYARVNAIKRSICELVQQLHETTIENRNELNKIWSAHVDRDRLIHEHDVRIVKLESTR